MKLLITGASSGIGYELAKQFADAGASVVALGRNPERLQAVSSLSGRITSQAIDLSNLDTLDTDITDIFKTHPDISIVINNAGIQENVRVDDEAYGPAEIRREIDVNLTAQVIICRVALYALKGREGDRIVNVTSGLAYVPKLTSAVYSATKSGLHLFSDALRVQSGADIGVSEVILPIVATPMTEGRGSGKISAAEAASQIMQGIDAQKDYIRVGKTRFLPLLLRFFPSLARRIIQKG